MTHPPPGGGGESGGDDRASFLATIESYRPMLYRYAMRLSGNSDRAGELVQEAFARALERFDQFRPGTCLGAWLAKILAYYFLDQVKHDEVVVRALPALRVLQPETCEIKLELLPDAELYAAIVSLEPELRIVIELCYLQRLTRREAAERLGIAIGTVTGRIRHACELLHERLTSKSRKDKP